MIAADLCGKHLGQWLAVGGDEFQIEIVIHEYGEVNVLLTQHGWRKLDQSEPVTLYRLQQDKVDHLVLAEPQQGDLFSEVQP